VVKPLSHLRHNPPVPVRVNIKNTIMKTMKTGRIEFLQRIKYLNPNMYMACGSCGQYATGISEWSI
jgi:hypothetical protein